MASSDVNSLTSLLEQAGVEEKPGHLSFAGRGIKLDDEASGVYSFWISQLSSIVENHVMNFVCSDFRWTDVDLCSR